MKQNKVKCEFRRKQVCKIFPKSKLSANPTSIWRILQVKSGIKNLLNPDPNKSESMMSPPKKLD